MRNLLLIISLLITTTISAQSLEEHFCAFQQSAKSDYTSFRDNANQQYADFMRETWEYYKSAPAIPVPKEEPVPPIIFKEQHQEREDQEIIIEEVITPPAPEPQPEPVEPIEPEPQPEPVEPIEPEPQPRPVEPIEPEPQPRPVEPIEPEPQPRPYTCQFKYFNTICEAQIPKRLLRLNAVNNDAFANGWEILSNGEYDETLADCLKLRKQLLLCDWAYLLMLYELSVTVYQANCNEAMLLCAWLYCQSGYQMRLALDGQKLHLLFASKHVIYGQSYFKLDGYNYYTLLPASENIQICMAAFEKEQALSLYVPHYPRLQLNYSDTRLLQAEDFKAMRVSVQTNRNLIAFYDTYPSSELNNNPLTRWEMYANTPLTDEVKQMIYPALFTQLQGSSYRIAVEKLLNFVQTAFVYEYDDKVWGRDRALFAEETLFYPYADCEDRSIFFSRLVRDLLDLPVVLIYYPGHLATAVAFPGQESGDYIVLNGKQFTICDPTYIGAPVGVSMPGMNNQAVRAILLQ